MRKLTSGEVAEKIGKFLRENTDWLVLPSCSEEFSHLQVFADNGASFIVLVTPISPERSEAENRAADALWNKIKNRISEQK